MYFLFLLSGTSSLIYQILWMRELGLIFGNTTYATGTVLAAFMGGLGLGSYILGKKYNNAKNPVKVYAILELIIGIYILVSPFIFDLCLPVYAYFYNNISSNFFIITILRLFISFAILFIPTFMMGGTLPILSKYFIDNVENASLKLGTLYAVNTFGACLGAAISTFLLIGSIGVNNTRYIAVFINIIVGFIGLYLSAKLPCKIIVQNDNSHDDKKILDSNKIILLALFSLSGFTSFGYEVIWTRLFIPFLGTSIYSFTLILLTVLIGIAFGSYIYRLLGHKISNALFVFCILELCIALMAIFNINICGYLDDFYYYLTEQKIITSWIISKSIILLALFFFLLPITLIFGFIFPLFSNIILKKIKNVSKDIGQLYAINTIGNILGSIFCGFVSIQFFGIINTIIFLALLNLIIGLTILAKYYFVTLEIFRLNLKKILFCLLIIICFLTILVSSYKKNHNPKDMFYSLFPGKLKGIYPWNTQIFYYKEDVDATIAAYQDNKTKRKGLLVNGVGITVLVVDTKLLSHLPIWIHGEPKSFLNICFGMGTTFCSTKSYPNLKVDTVEIIKSVYDTFKYFHPENEKYLYDGKVNTYYGDGVNYLKLTNKKYDIISLDPAPPLYAFGTVHLYTKEFYELCKKHLNTNGIMCQWICYGGISLNTYKMLLKTFLEVWPNAVVINSPNNIGTYVIGSDKKIDYNNIPFAKYLENENILKDLNQLYLWNPTENYFKSLFIFDAEKAHKFTLNAKVVTEEYPYLEFPLNNYMEIKKNVSYNDLLEFKNNKK